MNINEIIKDTVRYPFSDLNKINYLELKGTD